MRPLAPFHLRLLALLAVAGGAPPGRASEGIDFNAIYEARCQSCHGDAGPFAQANLRLDGDTVLRGNGQPLGPFLKTHMGGLADPELMLFLDAFASQIRADGVYHESCTFCHDPADEFARTKLILKDGVLTGRYSGHVIAEFLPGHARLTPEQARAMTEALTAILKGAR